jgi:hypothetical protein
MKREAFDIAYYSKCIFLPLTILLGYDSYAQRGPIETAHLMATWYEGKVTLQDTSLACTLRYDDLSGILKYKAHDNPIEVKTTRAYDITGFNYLDTLNRHRVFISVPYDINENGTMVPVFFEVLKEYKHFALLSGKLPMETLKKINPATFSGYGPALSTSFQQREVLCIFDDNGNLLPYLQVTNQKLRKRTSGGYGQILNEDVLKHYVGTDFAQLEEFSNKNKLSFGKKEDLLIIFDYYDKIKVE